MGGSKFYQYRKRKKVLPLLKKDGDNFLMRRIRSRVRICIIRTYFNPYPKSQSPKECFCDERPDVEIPSAGQTLWMIDDKLKTGINGLVQFCSGLCFFNQIINIASMCA